MVKLDFREIRREMESFEERRESIIQKSHEIMRLSKRLIYSIHRDDKKEVSLLNKQIKIKIGNLRTRGELQFSSFYKIAMQEYVEAVCFYEIIYQHTFPTQKELFVSAPDYLAGLCDLTGELMRKANNFVINKQPKEAIFIKEIVEEIYGQFLHLDIRDNDLRKKADSIKYNLHKLEDLVIRIQIRER